MYLKRNFSAFSAKCSFVRIEGFRPDLHHNRPVPEHNSARADADLQQEGGHLSPHDEGDAVSWFLGDFRENVVSRWVCHCRVSNLAPSCFKSRFLMLFAYLFYLPVVIYRNQKCSNLKILAFTFWSRLFLRKIKNMFCRDLQTNN